MYGHGENGSIGRPSRRRRTAPQLPAGRNSEINRMKPILDACAILLYFCNPIMDGPVVRKAKFSNPPSLYEWAKPKLVVASQRPLAIGPRDPLATVAGGHFPLLRTWQAGAIRLRW